MTMTSALPDAERATRRRSPSDDSGPIGRWVLHRAGILNVWQYDRVELRFGGGRLLLRGKNGAGKSKALEILLPFLLDGDTRRLDATGRDRTTVAWLMTDGRPPATTSATSGWSCAARTTTATERFLTLGAGLKASTATRRGDAWFFITDQRIGVDVELDRAGECLSVDRLKEALGEEAVTHSGAEHRRRVGRHVFGLFDEARYAQPAAPPAPPARPEHRQPGRGRRAGERAQRSPAADRRDRARRRGQPLRRPRDDPRAGRPLAAHGRRARAVPRAPTAATPGPSSAKRPAR